MTSFADNRILGDFLGRLERMAGSLKARWQQWVGADRYRPEKHYMRGPGPKCAANSNDPAKEARAPRDRDRRAP
jgi:hypothetical protein